MYVYMDICMYICVYTHTHIYESVSRSVMSDSFEIPWTVAHQVSLPMEFSRQGHWSGLPFPSPDDLPDPGI